MKWIVAFVLLAGCGATQVKVEPVKIQPIHITVDINLNDREQPPDSQDSDSAAEDTVLAR